MMDKIVRPMSGAASHIKPLAKSWRAPALIVAFFLLYCSTLAVHHSEAEDVLSYVSAVALGDPAKLFHPNHLLFENASYFFSELCRLIYPGIDLLVAMQLLQALSGAVALFILFRILTLVGVGESLGLSAVAAAGFSYGFWAYSVEADTYIIPLPFLLLALRELVLLDKAQWRYSCFIRMGLYLALATLFYQQYVLVVPALMITMLFLWRKRDNAEWRGYLTRAATLGLVSGLVTLGVYLSVAFAIKETASLSEAIRWSLGQGGKGLFHPVEFQSLIKSVVGFYKAIWGTNFLFGFAWFNDLAALVFPNLGGLEETYLAQSLSPVARWVSFFALLLSSLAFLTFVGLVALNSIPRAAEFYTHPLVNAVLLIMLFFGVFNTIFYPENLEFWIALVPLLMMLVFFGLSQLPGKRGLARPLLAVFLVGIGLANAFGSVIPQSSKSGDFWRDVNAYLLQEAEQKDLVLVRCGYVCNNYLKYGSRATIVPVFSLPIDELITRIDNHNEGRVLVSSFVFDPLPGYHPAGRNLSGREQAAVISQLQRYKGKLVSVDKTLNHTIYQLSNN